MKELVAKVQTRVVPWECFMLHRPAVRCRPSSKGDILQNGENSAGAPKSLAGEKREDLGSLILAPSLHSSEPSTRVCAEPPAAHAPAIPTLFYILEIHLGATPGMLLEKDGFFAGTFSQRTYREPHVPSSSPGHRASPAWQPT